MMNKWRKICRYSGYSLVGLLVSAVVVMCLRQPSEPEKGPMRYDVEPLQNRLALEGGILRAHWFVQRKFADSWGPPTQDNCLIVRGVIAAQAAEDMFASVEDLQPVEVSFAEVLVRESAWESPSLLVKLNEQLVKRQQKISPDRVLRFAWCPRKKLVYIELESH